MKVVCRSKELTNIQKKSIGIPLDEGPTFELVIGKQYTVLALTAQTGYYAGPVLQIAREDMEGIMFVPLCLFDVTDGRPSELWKIKQLDDFTLSFSPEEFEQEYFHDDLSNYEPDVLKIYRQVLEKLEHEFD